MAGNPKSDITKNAHGDPGCKSVLKADFRLCREPSSGQIFWILRIHVTRGIHNQILCLWKRREQRTYGAEWGSCDRRGKAAESRIICVGGNIRKYRICVAENPSDSGWIVANPEVIQKRQCGELKPFWVHGGGLPKNLPLHCR